MQETGLSLCGAVGARDEEIDTLALTPYEEMSIELLRLIAPRILSFLLMMPLNPEVETSGAAGDEGHRIATALLQG